MSFIACNNAGALFVHAAAENTSVADILQPNYVPPIVRSFFPLNGVKNCEGTSQPLLAVQVTELLDGVFIGCAVNHSVGDGKSFWLFVNSWAEISRGCLKISKLPSLEHWFPEGMECPIRFPFTMEAQKQRSESLNPPPERIFRFTKEKIARLKSKGNAEASTEKIYSLQALDYFGNATVVDGVGVTMKAGEAVEEGGHGKVAWEMNKMIALHSDETIKNHCESWLTTPRLLSPGTLANSHSLVTSSSPRFNVYGNEFGWGKPVAVRSGGAHKRNGKISVFAGVEEGSIDIEVCLPYEILEAMGNDPEFMDAISN